MATPAEEGVVATDEPMAEWERELLSGEAKGAAETTGTDAAAARTEAPAEVPPDAAAATDAAAAAVAGPRGRRRGRRRGRVRRRPGR